MERLHFSKHHPSDLTVPVYERIPPFIPSEQDAAHFVTATADETSVSLTEIITRGMQSIMYSEGGGFTPSPQLCDFM